MNHEPRSSSGGGSDPAPTRPEGTRRERRLACFVGYLRNRFPSRADIETLRLAALVLHDERYGMGSLAEDVARTADRLEGLRHDLRGPGSGVA